MMVTTASAGLTEGPPRAETVQPVKSLPLKSGFHGSADCSDAMSTKQRSVTMPKEIPFCLLTARLSENCFCGWFISLDPTSVEQSVNDWFSQISRNLRAARCQMMLLSAPGHNYIIESSSDLRQWRAVSTNTPTAAEW